MGLQSKTHELAGVQWIAGCKAGDVDALAGILTN